MFSIFDSISPKDARYRPEVLRAKWFRIDKFVLHPDCWEACPGELSTLTWDRIRFDKKSVKKLPDNKYGIYSFMAEPSVAGHRSVTYLLYIGKAEKQSLQKRVTSYLYESNKEKSRVHIVEMLERYPNHMWLHYAVVDDPTSIPSVEESLIASFLPPFNIEIPAKVTKLHRAIFS